MLKRLFILALVASGCAGSPASEVCATGIICPSGTQCAAKQPVCITNSCGDDIVQNTEKCDDGNIIDGDGCSRDCQSTEDCGNGVIDTAAGEVCDDGNTTPGDGCAANCRSLEQCGDGIKDPAKGEVCDDGNTSPGDGCSANCKSTEICGNGIQDVNEKCDDGGAPGGCNDDCQGGTGCGDGEIDKDANGNPIEECDDGNLNDDDDCTAMCHRSRCGDGIVDSTGIYKEDCDPAVNFGETNDCNVDCTNAGCGDGKINRTRGEHCDNGSSNADDKDCTAMCQVNVCGDGLPDLNGSNTEQCDDGNAAEDDGCTNECTLPHCGNGVVDQNEECDLGAQNSDTGACLTSCHIATCGDTKVYAGVEECDGAPVGGFTCAADCHLEKCGNSIVDPGETCDDGNTANDDGCSSTCHVEYCGDGTDNNVTEDCDTASASQSCDIDCTTPTCGDGLVNHAFTPMNAPGPEQCDPPTTNICSSLCQLEHCGNNIVDPGEQCDGAPVNGFTCHADCHLEKCGNGTVDPLEQCDDGNTSDNDDCLTSNTDPATCKIATCGDGVRNTNREDCDHGTNNGKNGDTCSATCHTVTCGDGIVEQGEQCDDGSGNNGAGKPCNASCQHNVCGDGDPLTGIEQCDEGVGDHAGCDSDCTLPVCGDDHKNTLAGEGCDHGTSNGTVGDTCGPTCQSATCGNSVVDSGEQCDAGSVDQASCDGDCTAVFCGDNRTNTAAGEACDDGASNGNPCAWNDENCTRCKSDCSGTFSPGGPFCGDSTRQTAFEACDLGSDNGAASCPYGTSCNLCSADCQTSTPSTGGTCGDRILDASNEACDDGTATSCGLCVDSCHQVITAAKASGVLVTPDATTLTPQKTFTIDDGYHTPTVFEIDKNNMVSPGNVIVHITDGMTANQVAVVIATAINDPALSATLFVSAQTPSGGIIPLVHKRFSSKGNRTISSNITDAGWANFGMSGGAGGDCATNIGCNVDNDCASNKCLGTHKCQ